jgi:hypothetical protein
MSRPLRLCGCGPVMRSAFGFGDIRMRQTPAARCGLRGKNKAATARAFSLADQTSCFNLVFEIALQAEGQA